MENLIVDGIKPHVGKKALIQGGAFRLDKGPTQTELHSFKLAVLLVEACRKEGKDAQLGCIVNDLALKPEQRPKVTGRFVFPAEYLDILQSVKIAPGAVIIFYESTLRNKARKDDVSSLRINRNGVPVAICASIMGRFYAELAKLGILQQIGFYAREPKPESSPDEMEDKACPIGPLKGALEAHSGYALRIEVVDYFVLPGGDIRVGGVFKPQVSA